MAFFYCNGNVPEKREARYILGSLIRQILSSCSLESENPQRRRLDKLYEVNQSMMPIPDMLASIESLSNFYEETTIIVDGLDECSRPTDVASALSQLSTNIKVLCTSRHETEIAEEFSDMSELSMNEAAIQADIGSYIDTRLANDSHLHKIKSNLKRHLKERLLAENRGM